MAPKNSTAHASAPVKKTTKKQAAKKTAASKPTTKKVAPKKAVAKKPKAKPASKSNQAISDAAIDVNTAQVTGDADGSSTVAITFYKFKKLPLELRLRIWGYAAPEPMTIIQRVSEKNNTRFTYRRKPPAVLHACRESRMEYLDTDEGPESASVARRRKEHPVYKLFFKAGRMRCSPAYFSVDIDSFYGRKYCGKARNHVRSMFHGWGGIAELDIAKPLKHLIVKYHSDDRRGEFFRRKFRNLETFTILFPECMLRNWFLLASEPAMLPAPPEIDGQVNLEGMHHYHRQDFNSAMSYTRLCFDKEKALHPEWTPPVLKFRMDVQFLANSNYSP
jgi:hypothetical protein